VFLDPPYDSEFSTYAKNEFDKDDQARLAEYLIKECKANFMIVIKNTNVYGNMRMI
jgi:DNA adenine methylase